MRVTLHDARYHGVGDWPPSPARLFQALVAGAARGGRLDGSDRAALAWLETCPSPVIAAPRSTLGSSVLMYVPDNDLDSELRKPRDKRQVAGLRKAKRQRPHHLTGEPTFLYLWTFEASAQATAHAEVVARLCQRLYQLGRGIDMAWASGAVISTEEAERLLLDHGGPVHRPWGGTQQSLACPIAGSLTSLEARYRGVGSRLRGEPGSASGLVFQQPPKAVFEPVGYAAAGTHVVLEIRHLPPFEPAFAPFALQDAHHVVVRARDAAVERLAAALPGRRAEIERVLVGRRVDPDPPGTRVRIVPLPSIGHEHADLGIRRLLVEVPPGCLISTADIRWAFSGLELDDRLLVASTDTGMLQHYGVGASNGWRTWRTVTPVVLPIRAARRPSGARSAGPAMSPGQVLDARSRASSSLRAALRHAHVDARDLSVRAQPELMQRRGLRAGAFAAGSRFAPGRLWHVEIELDRPVLGPLVIGDGRYLGLGVMEPVVVARRVHVLDILGGLAPDPDPTVLARALRRAVMARVQAASGAQARLPRLFTGHDDDGSASTGGGGHLGYAFDPHRGRLLVVLPSSASRQHAATLDQAIAGLTELRAGPAGRLQLGPGVVDESSDDLLGRADAWESVTPYVVTRHAAAASAAQAVEIDVRTECRRARLLVPRIEIANTVGVPGVGLTATVMLTFASAVGGPIMLGRTRHLGGGLFRKRTS